MKRTLLAAVALSLLPFPGKPDDDNSSKNKADDNSGNGFDRASRRILRQARAPLPATVPEFFALFHVQLMGGTPHSTSSVPWPILLR